MRTIPASFRKLIVKKLTPVFKEAVDIVVQPVVRPGLHEVLIKNKYVGVNASDVNMAAGRYFSKNMSLPFDIGFEGVGEIMELGDEVSDVKQGQSVMYMGKNAYAEYVYVPEKEVIPIVTSKPEFLPLMLSGTTASLSLDKPGRLVPGEKVLITAAAGGTGHIAVQWAKNAGCHVIGTCSSSDKVDFLKSIGCDRPINYKKENLEEVLQNEYRDGIDVIWESIGGRMLDIVLKNVAIKGRVVIVGSISGYLEEKGSSEMMTKNLAMKLLLRSSSLSGFLINHYTPDIPHYLSLLVRLLHEQKLHIQIDKGSSTPEGEFKGLEDITRAVEYIYSGQNKGKVIVTL